MGGTRKYDSQVWKSFGDRVGWRKKGKWLLYSELTFNLDTSYEGQLPSGVWVLRGGRFGLWEVESGLRGSTSLRSWYFLVKHWAGVLLLYFVPLMLFGFAGILAKDVRVVIRMEGSANIFGLLIIMWFWITFPIFNVGFWLSQALLTVSKKLAHIIYYTFLVFHGSPLFIILLVNFDYHSVTDYLAIPFFLAGYFYLYFYWWWLALRPLQKPFFLALLLRQDL